MTTATRRLRRGGVAGLAATVTAGVAILATATGAFAALTTAHAQASAAPTIYQGAATQTVGDVQIAIPDTFNAGDFFTVTYGANTCTTNTGNIALAGTPTQTFTGPFTTFFGSAAGTTTDTTPTASIVEQSSNASCAALGIKDQLIVTLTNNNTNANGDFYTLDIGGLTVTTGSTAPVGALQATVGQNLHGTTGAPTAVTGSPVTIATIANTKLTVASVVPASPPTTGTSTVALPNVTVSDVGSQVINTPITFSLSGGALFTAAGTFTGPAGTTWTASAVGGATLTETLATGTIPTTTANTYTLSGASASIPTGPRVYTISAVQGAGPTAIGAATAIIAAQAQTRIGGIDRYASSVALFNSRFGLGAPHASRNVVVASGASYADGLSAGFLAKKLGTGVVLTDANALPAVVQTLLTNASILNVYVVGGTAAVSQNVYNQIAALHFGNAPLQPVLNVVRVAGADRYATNNQVDLYVDSNTVLSTPTTAIVAVGTNFADALAVGPEAYALNAPLVLTDGATLSAAAANTLINLPVASVVIVGGTSAISAGVETAIKNLGKTVTYRIAGADRTLTAEQIAVWATTGLPAAGTYGALAKPAGGTFVNTSVAVARGDGFADALAAGPVFGDAGNQLPILLTGGPTSLGAGIPAFGAIPSHTTSIVVVGLSSAVSVATEGAAVTALS